MDEINILLEGQNAITLFLTPIAMHEDITKTFRVMPRVKTKTRMYFAGALEGIIQKNTGCGWNAQGQLDITDREIDPVRLKINLELCSDVFWDSIFENLLGLGLDIEKNPPLIIALIMRRVIEAIAKDIYVLGYFGDKTSATAFLAQLDGIWALIGDEIAATTITPEDASSGAALSSGEAYTILKNVVNNAPLELKQLPKEMKVLKVTSSIYENLQEYYEALGVTQSYTLLVDGVARLTFRGMLLEEHPIWDQYLAANQHRVLYTVNENLVMATDVTDPESELKMWEDTMKEEKFYVKGKFKMAFNYVHRKFMHVAV